MPEAVLSLDAGTSSVRALVFAADGRVLGRGQRGCAPVHPGPGRVELDLETLWASTEAVVAEALEQAALAPADLAAIGVTGQRAGVAVWERASGRPLAPLVGWQDLRGTERAAQLVEQGWLILPQMAAAKLEAVLDAIPDARARLARGELAWGNVDSFLVWRLSGGRFHVTDPGHACATGYYDYARGDWNDALLEAQSLPRSVFPKLVDSMGCGATTAASVLGAEVPIESILGDQQSALIGQGCRRPGEVKVTYGTSATGNVHTGPQILGAPGAYPLVLMRTKGETLYCIEAMVITAGAFFDWLVREVGLLDRASDAAILAASVPDSGGVHVLPALQGLGSPHGNPAGTARIVGLTGGTTRAQIVRAALEGVAYRVREMLDAVYAANDLPRPEALRVDGGAASDDVLMQAQADILGQPVERMEPREATALGAALLAGRACGLWDADSGDHLRRVERRFEPRLDSELRDTRFEAWREACGLA